MTTPSFNPMFYLNHAWSATHSVWGKASIVLFYSFVWIQIIWAIQIVIAPKAGWGCFFTTAGEYEEASFKSIQRQQNILAIGFFLYADRGGIKVWNVTMVAVTMAVWTWALHTFIVGYQNANNAPDCPGGIQSLHTIMWMQTIWSIVPVLCSLLDERAGRTSGTSGESAPLV